MKRPELALFSIFIIIIILIVMNVTVSIMTVNVMSDIDYRLRKIEATK